MKNLLIVLVSLFSAGMLRAQTPQQTQDFARKQGVAGYEDLPVIADLRLFEFEMGVGMNLGRKWGDIKAKPGTNLIFELRLNRPEPLDIALQFKMANFTHNESEGARIRTTIMAPSVFVDYNRRFNRRTALFAGVGFGGTFASNDAVYPIGPSAGLWFQENENAFAVTPRVGVSLFNFLRVTAEYSFTARDYSRFGLNIGLTLGGSYKGTYIDRRSKKEKFWEDTVPAIINNFIP